MLNKVRAAAVGIAIVLLVGCGQVDSDDRAAQTGADLDCQGPGLELATSFGGDVSLTASRPTDAGTVAEWQEHPRGNNQGYVTPSSFRKLDPAAPVTVCFFDGTFPSTPGRPEGPDFGDVTRRAVIEVSAGVAIIDIMDSPDDIPAEVPS
jgi:hypothetical protein